MRRLGPLSILLALLLTHAVAGAADSDAVFARQAAQGGLAEVELGRLASQRASNAKVRDFAEKMVADHGKANRDLQEAARRAGIALPNQMGDDGRDTMEDLAALQGSEFDRAYVDHMVEAHEKTVEMLRPQAAERKTEIDRWAANALPTVESHLDHARALDRELGAMKSPAARDPAMGSERGHP
jgi:putative membrane protein